jgi:tetratricopeptide (TPR) repeat protein
MSRLLGRLAAILAVTAALNGCSSDPEKAKLEYLKSGDRYMAEKQYREAIVQYRNALQQDPKFGQARYNLAEAYSKAGMTQQAGREYVRAADSLPNDVKAQIRATMYLLMSGQYEDARTRARKAVKLDPKSADAQIVLGSALAGLKDYDGALRELEEATKLDPNSAVAYASVGSVQLSRGSISGAEAAYRRAVEIAPKDVSAHLALANFLWAAGRPGDAPV